MEALLDSIEHKQIHSTTCFIVPIMANTPPEEIWKVDGATPIYQFIKGLSLSFAFGSGTSYFHVLSPWKLMQTPRTISSKHSCITRFVSLFFACIWSECKCDSVSVCTSNLAYQRAQINGFSWESYWRKATKDVKDVRFRKAVGGKCIIQLEPGLEGYARTVR